MRLTRRLATAALAVALLGDPTMPAAHAVAVGPSTASLASASDPGAGTTWSIAPSGADGPDGRVSIRLELEPGTQDTDHIAVTNHSEAPATFDLLASDGIVTEDGAFDVLPGGQAPQDGGTWVEIAPSVEVDGGATAVVPFTVRVPADATPGDHPAGIVAAITRAALDEGGNTVVVDSRVGIRLHLRITGQVRPAADVADVTATYTPSWNPFAPGALELGWTVENVGNVRLGAEQTLAVTGIAGLSAAEAGVVGRQREVLPGQGARESVSVTAWPLGPLDARLVSGHAAVGDDDVPGPVAASSSVVRVWAVPWSQLALGLALALLGRALVLARRRRRRGLDSALAAARAAGARDAARRELVDTSG
jgi:hypothetical protein